MSDAEFLEEWKARRYSAGYDENDFLEFAFDNSKRIEQALMAVQRHARLVEVVKTFTDGFCQRGAGAMMFQRLPAQLAQRLEEHVQSMRRACE